MTERLWQTVGIFLQMTSKFLTSKVPAYFCKLFLDLRAIISTEMTQITESGLGNVLRMKETKMQSMVLPWPNWLDFLKRRRAVKGHLCSLLSQSQHWCLQKTSGRAEWYPARKAYSCATLIWRDTDCGEQDWIRGGGPMATHLWRGLTNRMASNFCSPGCQPTFPTPHSLSGKNKQESDDWQHCCFLCRGARTRRV